MVLRVLLISKGREGADEIPALALYLKLTPRFDGGIPAVSLIDEVFHRDDQIIDANGVMQTVVVVVDGDEAYL